MGATICIIIIKITTKIITTKNTTKIKYITSLLGCAPGITVSVLAGESGEGFGVP